MTYKVKNQVLLLLLLTAFEFLRADVNDVCKGLLNGIFDHPTDSTKYIRCFHGQALPLSCPKGLIFDGNKRSCILPKRIPAIGKARRCIESMCKLPDCLCASRRAPNNLPKNETPQMVMISFDDAVTSWNMGYYYQVFHGRKNPNNCNITGTFFVCNVPTQYNIVHTLKSQGHEMADHTVSHRYPAAWWKNANYQQWWNEVKGEMEYLKTKGKVPQVYGFRAPFLQLGGNTQYEVLKDLDILYDSSIPTGGHQYYPPLWPYTLDYRSPQVDHCNIPPCPTDSFPGLWEVPMVTYKDKFNAPCAMYDACWATNEQEVFDLFMNNFQLHYKSNKAPFPVFGHASWFLRTEYNLRGFIRFLDEIQKKEDVYIVNIEKVIRWMQNPTPLKDLHKFKPWQC